MNPSVDRLAGHKLLENGTLVNFDVTATEIEPEGGVVRMELQLGEIDEDGERSADHEWGGLGFLFCLAVLSFHDARPRGISGEDFAEQDEFTIGDFLEHLRYERSRLVFSVDYLRGRCMKTDIRLDPDGVVVVETRTRGESATRWVQRLKGKKHLTAVSPDTRSEG